MKRKSLNQKRKVERKTVKYKTHQPRPTWENNNFTYSMQQASEGLAATIIDDIISRTDRTINFLQMDFTSNELVRIANRRCRMVTDQLNANQC